MKAFFMAAFLLFAALGSAVHAEPKERSIDLTSRTKAVIYVVPDLGVRFTFPFILDEQDQYIPFTSRITNPSFEQAREKGRNYFIVTTKRDTPGGVLGNLFMNVAGVEISVELRVTHDLTKHHSDIVFKMTDGAREDLIQKSIAQRSAVLEQAHQKKMEELDALGEQKAIAHVARLAITKPIVKNVKEEATLKVSGGGSITVFVDNVVKYEKYSVYLIDLEASRYLKEAKILDAKLLEVDRDSKTEKPVQSFNQLPASIRAGEIVRGSITILESAVGKKSSLKLEVVTDRGSVVVKW
jgi:hypothetical protein